MGTKSNRSVVRWCVMTCRPNDPLRKVADAMWSGECNCVFLVDGEGRAVSMLTDVDVTRVAFPDPAALETTRAKAVAPRHLVAVRPGASVDEMERLMRKHQLSRLAVVDRAGFPLGFTSLDLVERERSACGAGCRCACTSFEPVARVDARSPWTEPPRNLAA